jgi:hypothetical protein
VLDGSSWIPLSVANIPTKKCKIQAFHHRDPVDPDNYGENMQRPSDNDIIHEALAWAHRPTRVSVNEAGPAGSAPKKQRPV